MVIFHSHVKLPKGNQLVQWSVPQISQTQLARFALSGRSTNFSDLDLTKTLGSTPMVKTWVNSDYYIWLMVNGDNFHSPLRNELMVCD
jgi:hypothetical protein